MEEQKINLVGVYLWNNKKKRAVDSPLFFVPRGTIGFVDGTIIYQNASTEH